MISTAKKLLCLLLCISLSLFLASCSGKNTTGSQSGSETELILPLHEIPAPSAPYGDQTDNEVYRASIYYAMADGTVSMPSTRVLWLNSGVTLERRLAEELLKSPGGDALTVAPRNSRIASVEAAGPVVTVNVLPSSPLTDAQTALLAEAMGRTLLEIDGINGVSLLLAGRAAAISDIPVGLITDSTSMQSQRDEASHLALNAVQGAMVTRTAAVYYPSKDETCVLPVITPLTFDGKTADAKLIAALSGVPAAENAIIAVPGSENIIEKSSDYTYTASGERILNVYLTNDALAALNESGHDRQMFLASIVLTLTSFLPETDGVTLSIGGKMVTEVPVKNASNQKFASGIMRRSDFAHLIGKNIPLYFADENGMLKRETRAIGISQANSPRARICALMEGPHSSSLSPVLPSGLSNSDILGVHVSGKVASINLSADAYRLCQSFTREQEELFVYGLANTVCEISGISGIRLYFDGVTGSCLTHGIQLTGVILKNPGRISDD